MSTNVITGYPQMPALTQSELDDFLKQRLIARLGTMNEDGTIHLAPIYFLYDEGDILLGTQEVSRRVRNIKRNPNVTILIDDVGDPFRGVMIYGKATLEHENLIPIRARIFAKYGAGERAPLVAEKLCQKWKSVIVRIKPERCVSFDYSKGSLL